MKKTLLTMLGAVAVLASCQKDDLSSMAGSGGEVPVTISASMAGIQSRAIDAYGKGTTADRAILEVYTADDDNLYKRMVVPIEGNAKTATFDIRLVTSQEYDFVVWADKGSATTTATESSLDHDAGDSNDKYYETGLGLKAITANYETYLGSDENRDAFFGAVTKNFTTIEVTNVEINLKRPFGQLNVSTALTDVATQLLPDAVQVEYTTKVASKFDASTGVTSEDADLVWTAKEEVIETANSNAKSVHLSTDYIFAPLTGQAIVDFEMTFYKDETAITTNSNFKNIPIQRNYRTNVSGELMSQAAEVTVNVIPGFNAPDLVGTPTEVATVDEANTTLESDKTEESTLLSITTAVTGTSTIEIPAKTNVTAGATPSTSIILNEGVSDSATLTFDEKSGETYTGELHVTIPSDVTTTAADLVFDMPNATVYVNGVKVANVTAGTKEQTFVVSADSEITGTLTVKKGNVKVYGKVANIVRSGDNGDTETIVTVYEGAVVGSVGEGITVVIVDDSNNESNAIVTNTTTKMQYLSLKEAVAAAEADQTLELGVGTYTGDLTLTKNITIIGESSDAIIKGQLTHTGYTLNISNLTIESTEYGTVTYGAGSLIADKVVFNVTPNISNNNTAVMHHMTSTEANPTTTITNCIFNTEGARAIQLRRATSASITGCTFNAPYSYAVQIDENGTDLTFSGNTVNNCQLGVFVYGGSNNDVTVKDNTFDNVYFPYAAKPAAKNDSESSLSDFWYYVVEADLSLIKNKPNETIILAGSFKSNINLTYQNNNQTFISKNYGVNPTTSDYNSSWVISGDIKFGYDAGNAVIEGVTLDGLYITSRINQQYGGLKDVTIKNCVFDGNTDTWGYGYIIHQSSHASTENYTIQDNLFIATESTKYTNVMLACQSENTLTNVLFDGNKMLGGGVKIEAPNASEITISNNDITVVDGSMYVSMVAFADETSDIQYTGNTFSGATLSDIYLHSGDYVSGENLTYSSNISNAPYNVAAKGSNLDAGDLTYSGFGDVFVYYSPTATIGDDSYSSIAEAMDVANEGDIINLNSATFDEYIVTDKSLKFVGVKGATKVKGVKHTSKVAGSHNQFENIEFYGATGADVIYVVSTGNATFTDCSINVAEELNNFRPIMIGYLSENQSIDFIGCSIKDNGLANFSYVNPLRYSSARAKFDGCTFDADFYYQVEEKSGDVTNYYIPTTEMVNSNIFNGSFMTGVYNSDPVSSETQGFINSVFDANTLNGSPKVSIENYTTQDVIEVNEKY